jgi:hypothetical protein
MNPRALQQAIVRMMIDPAFVAQVHGKRPVPGLAEDERALLRAVDRRAFTTDRFRRARAVQALVEEYPCSAAAIGLTAVDAFLSAPEFAACVADRGSMALSFGTWLKDQASGVGVIEAAMARLRRPAAITAHEPGALRCGPRFAALLVPEGTLAWYEATRAWLGAMPLQRIADHGRRPGLPRRGLTRRQGEECALLEARGDGSMDLGTASEALVRLLRFADRPRSRGALEAEARARGAEAHEATEVIDELLAGGLLVPA